MNMNDPGLRARMQQRAEPVTFGGNGYSRERMTTFQTVTTIRQDAKLSDEAKIQALKPIADDLLRRVDSAGKRDARDMLNDVEGIYTSAIDFDKEGKLPALLTNRALARIKNEKLEAAQADCEAALELDPKWTRAFLRLAFIASLREDWELAIEHTKMADSLAPDDLNKVNIEKWEKTLEAIPAKKREQMKKDKEAAESSRVVFFADEDFVSDDYKSYIKAAGLGADVVCSVKDFTKRLKEQKQKPLAAMWFNVSSNMPGREFVDAARDYIAAGGLFIALGERRLLRSGFNSLCSGCAWKPSGYSRLTPEVNRSAVPPPPSGCAKSICIKSCWLDGSTVPPAEQWYATKGAQKMKSMVFNDTVSAGQVGVAFHCPNTAEMKGALMFIGDLNWESSSAQVAMQTIQWWKTK